MSNLENFLPILPLRDIVVFPHMIVPLFVGRDKSIKALEAVMSEDKKVFLIAQKDGSIEDPSEKDLYRIGTLGNILQLLKHVKYPNNSLSKALYVCIFLEYF